MVDFADDIRACIQVLNAGGVILYPTDTVWGIGCDATDELAVDKVFSIKHRPAAKSLIILLPDARDILKHVAAPPPDVISMVESFETPTTIVFSGAIGFAENAISEDGSVAIRVPDEPFCKALLKRFGKPIISTSANLSGDIGAAIFSEINPAIVRGCDYVVGYRQSDNKRNAPSRLLKVDEAGEMKILRA